MKLLTAGLFFFTSRLDRQALNQFARILEFPKIQLKSKGSRGYRRYVASS